MNQRVSAVFYPEKKSKKEIFYKRVRRLVVISVISNVLLLAVYFVPFVKQYIRKITSRPPAPEIKIVPVKQVSDSIVFNADHIPYLYAGHSFPEDSTEALLNRDTHFALLMAAMDPATEKRFNVHSEMHKVIKGETLYTIGKKYGVSVALLRETNTIPRNGIIPGMFIKIMKPGKPVGYYGIDVSSRENSIDWKAVHADTTPFALTFYIMKATQGKESCNPYFKRNWEQAKNNGAVLGAYHVYVADEDPVLQADNYIRSVHLAKGNFRPLIDLEVACSTCDSLPVIRSEFVSGLHTFLGRIKQKYGAQPVIYTNRPFYNKYLRGDFDDYIYWMASYTETAPGSMNVFGQAASAALPAIRMWQFSPGGKIKGVAGNAAVSFIPADNMEALLY